jgi:hypothetical protein
MATKHIARIPTAPATPEDMEIRLDRVSSWAGSRYAEGDCTDGEDMFKAARARAEGQVRA